MGARLQNRYELGDPVEFLDDGVWHGGEDVRTRRAVRIALLSQEATKDRITAFERTARLALRVRHPGLEKAVATGLTDEGQPYLVVERLDGERLSDRLRREPVLKLHDVLRSITSVLNGLQLAHQAGLVHGAIDPTCVLIDDKLRAQLVAFGLQGSDSSGNHSERLLFLAPEVSSGGHPTPASDVYGMGAILYRALVGEAPDPENPFPLRERRRAIPAALAEAVERAITTTPRARPSMAGELRKELTAAMIGAPGLRTILVVGEPQSENLTSEATERLSISDLEEPTLGERVAWTKTKAPVPPPPPLAEKREVPNVRRSTPNVRRSTPATLAGWGRIETPPLLEPANSSANIRSSTPETPTPAQRDEPVEEIERADLESEPLVEATPASDDDEPLIEATPASDDDEPLIEATSGDDEDQDEDEDDALVIDHEVEAPWEGSTGAWPYPTGGPPGIATSDPIEEERTPSRAGPAIALGLLGVGVLVTAIGGLRLVGGLEEAEAVEIEEGTLTAGTSTSAPRPRRLGAIEQAQGGEPEPQLDEDLEAESPDPSLDAPVDVEAPAPADAEEAPRTAGVEPTVAEPDTAAPAPASTSEERATPTSRRDRASRRARASAMRSTMASPSRMAEPSMSTMTAPPTMRPARPTIVRDPGF